MPVKVQPNTIIPALPLTVGKYYIMFYFFLDTEVTSELMLTGLCFVYNESKGSTEYEICNYKRKGLKWP